MDVRTAFAAQNYAQARPATQASPQETGENSFIGAIGDFAQTLAAADQTAQAAMTGTADPYALVEALAASELAVETAVTVRDKVVEAYQEILRMPV